MTNPQCTCSFMCIPLNKLGFATLRCLGKNPRIFPMDGLMAMIPMVEFAKNHLKQMQDYRIFPQADTYHLHWECLSYKIVVTCGIWRTSNVQGKKTSKKKPQTNNQTNKTQPKPNNFQMNQNHTNKESKKRNTKTKTKTDSFSSYLPLLTPCLTTLVGHIGCR